MEQVSTIHFAEFRVDLDNEQLYRGPDIVALPPKEFLLRLGNVSRLPNLHQPTLSFPLSPYILYPFHSSPCYTEDDRQEGGRGVIR